ncbi:MAG: HupE/UreJ family protein [Gammaproteobacteria bacterium]
MKIRLLKIAASVMAWGMVMPAHAHTGSVIRQDYLYGLLHPLTGIDHVLVMLGIGIWGAVLSGTMRWLLPAVFLLMMSAGAAIGFTDFWVRGVEMEIAFSVLAVGLILASERKVPAGIAMILTGAFALGHGYVHAAELESGMAAVPYAAGFMTSTILLLLLGSASYWMSPSSIWKLRNAFAFVCTLAGIAIASGI